MFQEDGALEDVDPVIAGLIKKEKYRQARQLRAPQGCQALATPSRL